MISLVWKDLVAARWFVIAALPLYAIQLVTMSASPPALILLTVLFTALFAFGSIALEEVQGTGLLWCSLPVERWEIVVARYLTVTLAASGGLALSFVLGSVGSRWFAATPGGSTAPQLGSTTYALLFFVILTVASIYLPCYFLLGAGRGLILFGLLALGFLVLSSATGSLVVYLAGGSDALQATRAPSPDDIARARAWLDRWGGFLAATVSVVALLLAAASAALSARFYTHRDC